MIIRVPRRDIPDGPGMNAFMYFGPRIFHSLHLNAPPHETGKNGLPQMDRYSTGVLTTVFLKGMLDMKRPSRGKRFCSFSVVVNSGVGSRPTVLFRSLSQSWKGIASWKSVNRSWCLCMCFIESHEFYWNRVLGFESAYLVESPNVVYKLYAYRAALWLGWDGEHSGKQVSGNEQCCELFGDLPCPLSGRSLLGVVDP